MTPKLHEIEKLLRNGKLPNKSTLQVRHKVWQQILSAQRERRTSKSLLKLPPWIWPMGSIILILLCLAYFLLMK